MPLSSLDLDSGADPLIGQTLGGKYTIERLIGRGGMGLVYSATSHEGGSPREVVVKMIAPPLAQQPQALARFEREAKRLDGLRHSNIVEMYDYGREGGRAYIVMEYVDGELLSDFMARKGSLSLAEFVPIAAQILKGVGHAHSRDLMIRDIKPSNVMLCERKGRANFVKIIDFGLAKMLEGDEDITKQHFIGTSGYLSPEQIKGMDIDLRVDVYALGVLFYNMLSGRMPFEAENDTTLLYKHVHEFPTPLSEILPANHGVPDELVHLIHDCLEKDPGARPRDANEIVEKLIDCVPMAMFKLPAATESAAEQTAISALATAALNAPTGETATFLKIEQVGDDERSAASLSVAKKVGVAPSSSGLSGLSPGIVEPPPKSKTGLFVAIGVGAAALIAVVAIVLGNGDKPADEANANPGEAAVGASDTAQLEAAIDEAEKLIDSGDFNGASSKLDTIRGQLGQAPAFAGKVERLDGKIEVGRLLQSAHQLESEGKVEAALSTYQAVLEIDKANAEARARIAELSKSGTAAETPPPEPSSSGPGKAEPGAEKKPGKKKIEPKPAAAEPPPPEPKPEPKPEKDNPFLPTKKKNESGPFLPTEK
jgi:serine/threonine protein kinase